MHAAPARAVLASILVLLLTGSVGAADAVNAISGGPYLQDPGQTHMTVMWTSDQSPNGTVRYGAGTAADKLAKVTCTELAYAKDQEQWRTPLQELSGSQIAKAYVYKARLDGLQPGTTYRYVVDCGGQRPEGSFRTFPAKPEPFTFIEFGDTHFSDRVASCFGEHNPAFLINTGDLVTDEYYDEYRQFLSESISAAAGRAPLLISRGNHDGSGKILSSLFSFPGGKLYYSFDYGNAHFVCLDSVIWRFPDREANIKAMLEWCERDLKASKATWKIVFFHEPPYDMSDIRGEPPVREYLPVLRRCGTDLVMSGHAHAYERFRPLFWPGENELHPITYVISGGGYKGTKDVQRADPHLAVRKNGSHYVVYAIDGETLTARALTNKGKLLDTFTIVKKDGRLDPAYLAQAVSEEPFARLDRGLFDIRLPKASFDAGETFVVKLNLEAGSQATSVDVVMAEDSRAAELLEPAKGIIPANGSLALTLRLKAKTALEACKDGTTHPGITFDCRYKAGKLEGVIASNEAHSTPPP